MITKVTIRSFRSVKERVYDLARFTGSSLQAGPPRGAPRGGVARPCFCRYSKGMANEHDLRYRKLFSNPRIMEELLVSFVDESWVRDIDFSKAERMDRS